MPIVQVQPVKAIKNCAATQWWILQRLHHKTVLELNVHNCTSVLDNYRVLPLFHGKKLHLSN
jgi:hypothetical protein